MRPFIALTIVVYVACALNPAFAKQENKVNRGRCVSDCVQSFNKSTNDRGEDDPGVTGFVKRECATWCKQSYDGQGYFWRDGQCVEAYSGTDPDCAPPADNNPLPDDSISGLPFGAPCFANNQCASNNCVADPVTLITICSFPIP